MRRVFENTFFIILSCGLPLVVMAATTIDFSRDLSVDDRGEDVRHLQKFLNADKKTRVAWSGPGSPGQETDYFGELTRMAVQHFQELYAHDILNPLGLHWGTGFVGPATRAKIRALSLLRNDPRTSSGATSSACCDAHETEKMEQKKDAAQIGFLDDFSATGILAPSNELMVAFPSSYTGAPGDAITLSGTGFIEENNTVVFGDRHAVSGIPAEPNALRFTIPRSVGYGKYDLLVRNANGESNTFPFIVVARGILPPTIINISPKEGVPGQVVTIEGSGFASIGNDIYTGYGIIRNVPSVDGKSLMFLVDPTKEIPGLSHGRNFDMPIRMYVVNENGVSDKDTTTSFLLHF